MRTNAHPRDQPRPRRVIVVPRLDVTRDQAPWPDEEEEIDPSYSPPSSSGSCSRCDDSDGSENMTDNNSDASASDDDDGECDESPLSSWGTSLECSSDDEEDDESEGDEYDDDEVEYID